MKHLPNFCLTLFISFTSDCCCANLNDADEAIVRDAITQYNSSLPATTLKFKLAHSIITGKVQYIRNNSKEIYHVRGKKSDDNRYADFVIKTTTGQESFEKLRTYLDHKDQKILKLVNIPFFQGRSAVEMRWYFSIMDMAKGEVFIDIMKNLLNNATAAEYEKAKIAYSALGIALAKLHKEGDFTPGTTSSGPTSRLVHNDLNCGNILYNPDYGITFIDTANFIVDQQVPIEKDLEKLINTTIFLPFIFLNSKSKFVTQTTKNYVKNLFIEFARSYNRAPAKDTPSP